MDRRQFLTAAGFSALGLAAGPLRLTRDGVLKSGHPPAMSGDQFTLRIAPVLLDIAKGTTLRTVGYNGTSPGPLLRMREGVPTTVDVYNDTAVPELVHWHGQFVSPAVDGAEEERTPFVPPHGHRRYVFTPRPSGLKMYHTHTMARDDLHRGQYTGQHGLVYIEPKQNPGRYDREVFLMTHEWQPFLTDEEEMSGEEGAGTEGGHKETAPAKDPKPNGWEIGYKLFSINGKALGHGEPIRVRQGERVLFHIANGSATENIQLALPGHRFRVVALDGYPVPSPQTVEVLHLGTAERVSALVEMDAPGVWILGTPRDDDRANGLGVVVEYAGRTGKPQWFAPKPDRWDYLLFGKNAPARKPDETIKLVFGKINGGRGGFNRWTINGKSFPHTDTVTLHRGRRYRLAFINHTDDAHPIHLHRHAFELTKLGGKTTSGILKDVVLVAGYGRVEVDFVADNPGLTLFHCHQQLHMDYGFMSLFQYA